MKYEMAKEDKIVENKLDIQVADPEVLRPKELPLVITPGKGQNWLNAEQAEYAAVLNGYAYKNPEKWAKKKVALLKDLEALGKDPSIILRLRGNRDGVSFKNKLIEK